MTVDIDHRPRKIGWQRASREPSLVEAFASVPVAAGASFMAQVPGVSGPRLPGRCGLYGPGNWATAVAGGSRFGYALLFVALLSRISWRSCCRPFCARLAIATGRDPRPSLPGRLSLLGRDNPLGPGRARTSARPTLAEVLGTAIALNLLFGLPIEIGVVLTALDVFVVLWLQNKDIRSIEAFIITLLGVVAISFAIQLAMANPDWRPGAGRLRAEAARS